MQALGQARTAEVQRDARIGEAEAKQESSIAEAKAEMQRMEAALSNQTEIARDDGGCDHRIDLFSEQFRSMMLFKALIGPSCI